MPLLAACVPTPANRTTEPSSAAESPVAVVSASPVPSGPTPSPSFVRPTPTPLPTFLVYTVRDGDTLSAIARTFSTDTFSLAVWNRDRYPSLDPDSEAFRPDRIQVGWQLVLIPEVEVDPEVLLESPDPGGEPTPDGDRAVVVHHGPRTSNQVALTFDMGGRLDPAVDILTWLADREVPATIFPTGKTATTTDEGLAALELVSQHRDLFDLGNHSWSHPDFRELDDAAIRDQLERTEAAILAAVNVSTKPWFRPPYGGVDDQIPISAGAAGWGSTVLWDIDTIDWKPISDGGPTADAIVDLVVSDAQGGSIILMHLGGYDTLAALPGIVDGLEELGLTPVTLGHDARRLTPRRSRGPRRSRLQPAGLDDPLEELPGPRLDGVGEDLLGWAGLGDDAAVEEADPVRDLAGEAHLVGRDDHRHAAAGQLTDDIEDLGDQLRVEGAGDLVEQEQIGSHRQGPDDRDALLLTAGQSVRELQTLVGEAEPLEETGGVGLGGRPLRLEDLARGERDVVQDGHVREQVERLEDDADPPPDAVDVHAGRGDLVALDDDPTAVDRLERLMQRSRVDLPDPLAPMRHTTSCSATVRSRPRRTSRSPNDFSSSSISSAGGRGPAGTGTGAVATGSVIGRPPPPGPCGRGR